VAVVAGDVLDEGGGDVGEGAVPDDEHRLDTGQVPVHQGHRVLGVEVRAAAQPLDDGGGARVAAVVGEQAGDGLDPHVQPLDGGAGQLDPPVEVEEVALGRVVGDRDDDLVEDVAGTADDVDVSEGD